VPDRSLTPAVADPSRARLAALELTLAEREQVLADRRSVLQALQDRYLDAVGASYRTLTEIEAEAVELEIRMGLRAPVESDEASSFSEQADAPAEGCTSRASPSSDLKKIFRTLARTIHPDLALDEPARWRRHSLMAEANRAYAERDEDRLRLILHAWERSSETILDADCDESRIRRRMAAIEDRLILIDAELTDLDSSAIGQLKRKVDDAKAKGWDLLAEMILEVKREVGRAQARLAGLKRMTLARDPR
jgi:hypothetical protein